MRDIIIRILGASLGTFLCVLLALPLPTLAIVDDDTSLSSDQPRTLIIYDGNDPGGYDPYHDLNFTDGALRKKIIERSNPTYAVDAVDLKQALSIIETFAIEPESIDRIAIVDHGDVENDPPIQTLGIKRLKPREFRELGKLLKPEGDVCLYGCKVGKNVRYLKRISKYLEGRKVWAYAGVLAYDRKDPPPLPDPDENMFFYYPMY